MSVLSSLCAPIWCLAMSRAEALRRLAAQLFSLANLEAAVAHDVQALLEAPPEPVVPIPPTAPVLRVADLRLRSRSRSPLPKAALSRPRGSILLNQRGTTGLFVKSSPVPPPERSVSSCRHSCSSASVNGPVEPRSTAGVARSPAPSEPCDAAADPTASAARKASQRRRASGAAEARQRRRGQASPPARRSMWRELQPQAFASRAMWSCCADSSSNDDEHNTSNTLLLVFAGAFVAPALLADLRELDELMVALPCRFALDIFTIAEQDWPRLEPDLLAHDPGCDLWFCGTASPGPPGDSTVWNSFSSSPARGQFLLRFLQTL